MIGIDTKLSGDIVSGLDKFEKKIKGEILISAAAAGARVIYEELKLNTSPPRMGRVTGTLHDAVYRVFSQSRSNEDQKAYHIGVNKSKAPHWHFLEYGTSKQPARPYIRPAFDAKIKEAIDATTDRIKEKLSRG